MLGLSQLVCYLATSMYLKLVWYLVPSMVPSD